MAEAGEGKAEATAPPPLEIPGEVSPSVFPKLLMKLLNDQVAPDALWWLPDGEAFAMDPHKIGPGVLDKHFRGTKLTSFVRRLHNCGFRRTTRKYKKDLSLGLPEAVITMSNEQFLRDSPELLDNFTIKPIREKHSKVKEAIGKAKEGMEKEKKEKEQLGKQQKHPVVESSNVSATASIPQSASVPRVLVPQPTAQLPAAALMSINPAQQATRRAQESAALLALQEQIANNQPQTTAPAISSSLQERALSLMQRQQELDEESSRLRQQILMESFLGTGDSTTTTNATITNPLQALLIPPTAPPQVDLPPQQRTRSAAELLMDARQNQLMENLGLARTPRTPGNDAPGREAAAPASPPGRTFQEEGDCPKEEP
ncbi:shock factor protein [Seminavis robusta]|uniref:Shock factor protein n=1 Tax=Seminavis robusta TaxID=568900 RepID=A0A9N8DQH5_9STRA|nr:shock factor protein [Seminavis robusta]|eukprot:Sro279_g106830.1 shock factor protein (372) ;mRNA; r:46766-47983